MWRNLKMRVFRKSSYISFNGWERGLLFLKGLACMLVLNYCFYRKMIAFLFLWLPALFFAAKEAERLRNRKREEIRQQFKEMLSLTAAGQRAGYAVENAFLSGYDDLVHLFGQQSAICKMLRKIQAGMENHLAIGPLWKTIGDDCDIVEIREFAQVFSIAKESGGNMVGILESTASLIADKTETKKEWSRQALFLVYDGRTKYGGGYFLCHFGGGAYPKAEEIHTHGIHGGGFPLR